MNDRPLLIANPAAGGGKCGKLLADAERRLINIGMKADVVRTSGPGHAMQIAAEATDRSTILVAGGDGTFFEVVNGVMSRPADQRPALGTIPLGTGNSFLRDFNIRDADGAFTALAVGRRSRVDVVRAEHTTGQFWFINLLSLGFVSKVGALTNRRFKVLGPAGYAVATVIEVGRLAHDVIPLSLDGGPIDAQPVAFYSFNNSRCTGGDMQMAPNASPFDGLLDVIRVGPMGRMELLNTFPKIYAGKHILHPLVSEARAAEVRFQLDHPVDIMVDGEVIRHQLTRLVVEPKALEILA